MLDLERDLVLEPFVDGNIGVGMGAPVYANFGVGVSGRQSNGMSFSLLGRLGASTGGTWSAGVSAGIGGTF
jgi:hypothetical protein